jgi:hypothetical protein
MPTDESLGPTAVSRCHGRRSDGREQYRLKALAATGRLARLDIFTHYELEEINKGVEELKIKDDSIHSSHPIFGHRREAGRRESWQGPSWPGRLGVLGVIGLWVVVWILRADVERLKVALKMIKYRFWTFKSLINFLSFVPNGRVE